MQGELRKVTTKDGLKNISRIEAPQIPPLEAQFTTCNWWQP